MRAMRALRATHRRPSQLTQAIELLRNGYGLERRCSAGTGALRPPKTNKAQFKRAFAPLDGIDLAIPRGNRGFLDKRGFAESRLGAQCWRRSVGGATSSCGDPSQFCQYITARHRGMTPRDRHTRDMPAPIQGCGQANQAEARSSRTCARGDGAAQERWTVRIADQPGDTKRNHAIFTATCMWTEENETAPLPGGCEFIVKDSRDHQREPLTGSGKFMSCGVLPPFCTKI